MNKKLCYYFRKMKRRLVVEEPSPNVHYKKDFIPKELLDKLKSYLEEKHKSDWFEKTVLSGGRLIARKQKLVGDDGISYNYSGGKVTAVPWDNILLDIKKYVENYMYEKLGIKECFNAVLINIYETGDDHIGWHKDSEKDLGKEVNIASLSLGGGRRFSLRGCNKTVDYDLEDNDFLVLLYPTNRDFEHCIRKTKKRVDVRFNLTFRRFLQ